jgi:hypothetical protein
MFDLARERTALHSAYPERHVPKEGWFDRHGTRLVNPLLRRLRVRQCMKTAVVEQVAEQGPDIARLSDDQLTQLAKQLRDRLRRIGHSPNGITMCRFSADGCC